MKKTKLVFKRQNIAKLTGENLARVGGGGPGSIERGACSGTCHTCDCYTFTVEQFGCSCDGY